MGLLPAFYPEDSLLKLEFIINEKSTVLDSLLKEATVSFEVNKIPSAKFTFLSQQTSTDGKEILPTDILSGSENAAPIKIQVNVMFQNKSETIFKGIIKSVDKQNDDHEVLTKIECKDPGFNLTLPMRVVENNNDTFKDRLQSYTSNANLKLDLKAGTWANEQITHHASIAPWDYIVSFLDAVGIMVVLRNGTFDGLDIVSNQTPKAKYTAENGINVFSFSGKKSPERIKSNVVVETWDSDSHEVRKFESTQQARRNEQSIRVESSHYAPETYQRIADATKIKSKLAAFSGKVSTFGNLTAKAGDFICFNKVNTDIDKETLLIVKEEHTIENGCWRTEYSFGLESEASFSEHTTTGVNNSQSQVGQSNTINGLQIGIVTQIESDPNHQFRIKVRLPMLAENGEGIWARLATLYASNEMGSFFIPDVNDEVIVACLGNNPDTPVVLGSLYSGKNKAPFPITNENDIKGFVTKTGTKVIFDDDKKVIELSTKKGNKLTISDESKGITIEDENKNMIVLNDKGITLESCKDFHIKAKKDIHLEAMSINGKATKDMTLKGAFIKLN